MTRRLAVALVLARVALAHAHGFDPALLEVTEGGAGQYALLWKRAAGPSAMTPRLPDWCRALDAPPPAVATSPEPHRWRVDCGPHGLGGAPLAVDGLDPRLDVVVRVAWRDGRATTAILRADAPALRLPGGPSAGIVDVSRGYVGLGLAQMLGGADHLLLVFGLLLLVPERRALLRTMAAFTVAHSVTLALAVMDLIALPSAPVEATIGLSVVAVAVEALRDRGGSPTSPGRRASHMAFAFGLLHGLGLAGALRALGLAAGHRPLALGGFNVGVELGELAVVALAWPAVVALRRAARRRPALAWIPAYAVGALAVARTLDRVVALWPPPA